MSSLSHLSLEWLTEHRPDLLPSVDIEGRAPWSMHEETEWDERFDAVTALLTQLTPDRQALIYAVVMRGLSNREYAALKGVNESSVRRQRARTLKTLRKLIEDERSNGSPHSPE